jgi:hypothetical protein
MAGCINHPEIEAAATCGRCGRPLCERCVVELLGQRLCAACRDWRVAELQGHTARVYNSARRRRTGSLVAFLFMVALFLPPGLLLLVLRLAGLHLPSPAAGLLTIGAFLVGVGAVGALSPRLALWGNTALRRDVSRKLAATGVPPAAMAGTFVGISPGQERRSYDGDSHWDVGFLYLEPGWLAYYGDQVRFALRPHQLQAVDLDPPDRFTSAIESRLLLRWQEPAAGLAGTLALGVREWRTRREARQRLEELKEQLARWQAGPSPDVVAPPPLPPVQVPGGNPMPAHFTEPAAMRRWFGIALLLALLAVAAHFALLRGLGIRLPVSVWVLLVLTLSNVLVQGVERLRKRRAAGGGDGAGSP